MDEPNLDWPPMGRVGFCRAGDRAGTFIFLYAEIGVANPDFVMWEAHFEPPVPHRLETAQWAQHSDGFMQQWIRDWEVEWAPDDLDALVEARLFGERAQWPETEQKARNSAQVIYRAAHTTEVFGRVSSPTALGEIIREARKRSDKTPGELLNDPRISARHLTESDVRDAENGLLPDIQKVIYVLQALDLDLAVAPKRGGMQWLESDPWAEFR